MKALCSRALIVFMSLVVAFTLSGVLMAGGTVTVTGTVNEDYQIVGDDGTIYEVDDTNAGNEVIEHVGKKVKLQGALTESEGAKVITVMSYEILEE
jgi:hypothetical protein